MTAPGTTPNVNAELATGGEIEGTVKAPGGVAAAADVQVCTEGGTTNSCAFTNASGVYTIKGLEEGNYEVRFVGSEAANYAPQYDENAPSSVGAKQVHVVVGGVTKAINAELHPGAHITGQVTAASGGAKLTGIEVCADGEGSTPGSGCAETGAGGEYTISGLAGGSYKVEFLPNYFEGFELFEAPNYLEVAEEDVSVVAEATRSGVDAALASGGQIIGTVTAASGGAGLTKILVCAERTDFGRCAYTHGGGGSASAASNALAVPAPDSNFALAKAAKFNAKTGDIDVFLTLANAGTLRWNLSFKNSDVRFADSLGLSLGGAGQSGLGSQGAQAAKRKRCKAGSTKHKGRCVHLTVPFASGSETVPAGTIEVKVHADAKALRALKTGHTLHVSGPFEFQSSLGGAPVTHIVSVVIHPSKKKHRR